VEAAREAERTNKMLKAEVQMLRGQITELLGIVGQHVDCSSDQRLRMFLQRRMDNLAATGGQQQTQYSQSMEASPQSHEYYPVKKETP